MSSATAPAGTSAMAGGAGWGLAVLRVVAGVTWLHESAWKQPPAFSALRSWVERPLEFPVFAPYNAVVEALILPNLAAFGWLVYLTEAALGAFLIVGLATRLWAAVGAIMTVPIMLSVLNYSVTGDAGTLEEWSYAYYMMLAIHVALFATAAGRGVALDGVLRPGWGASRHPVARLLVRLS
ncbi:MAG: TQO small subunit DoxD [Egibacteraceae bacterium]